MKLSGEGLALDIVEELDAGLEVVLAAGKDEVVIPLRADLADALLADFGSAAGEGSGDLELPGQSELGIVDLSAEVNADAAFVEEIWRDGGGVGEAEDVIVTCWSRIRSAARRFRRCRRLRGD